MFPISQQLSYLFILAIPIACIAWTVTHEEIFAEPRNYCKDKSKNSKRLVQRKFFYLFTCEYCFSFYVTALVILVTNYQLLYENWRGYIVAEFALVWVANIYMSLFLLLRTNIKKEKLESNIKETDLKKEEDF